MNPFVGEPFAATDDVTVIPTYWPVPNVGHLPMNAFVVHAEEPVLVDTGVGVLSDDFLGALSSVIRPERLRWIWLTHDDRDHTGSVVPLLESVPQARIITDFFTVGRMSPETPLPLDRLQVVTPGDRVSVGDRTLRAWRPPLYDSPSTSGLVDERTGALFSSDCFGAPLPTLEEAQARDIAELPETTVTQAQIAWATVDSPWVTSVDQHRFRGALNDVVGLDPATILSSHLPPARDRTEQVVKALAQAPSAPPAPGTTQTELEALLASLQPGAAG